MYGLVIMVGVVLFLLVPVKALAHRHSAYSNEPGVAVERATWMENIEDDRLLSSLSIPGTHDSASNGPGGDIVRNQRMTLTDQLLSGIRFLDIRARLYQGDFAIHHDLVYLKKNFDDVLRETTGFLRAHPSETVYMRLKQEYSTESDAAFTSRFEQYVNQLAYHEFIYDDPGNTNPSLGETRGKLVILRDFKGSSYGMAYDDFDIQDNYQLRTNWDLHDYKWLPIKRQLIAANEDRQERKFINYLSGSGGAFPYFVASGHSSPGTGAPRLATGLTTPGWKNAYPDFPRVNQVGWLATIAFEGTNVLTQEYILAHNSQHVGIVVADFPGEGLIGAIIGCN